MKKLVYVAGLLSMINAPVLLAVPVDSSLLIGTWQCSFEINSTEQTLVGTSVDTYFADGTSHSDSRLSAQLHSINLDVAYELSLEATWQVLPNNQLAETITAIPKFITSSPELEQIINLKAELMNGKTEAAQIVELTPQRAVFRTNTPEDPQHEIRCTR